MLQPRHFKWLPNALTSLRYVFAVAVCFATANGRWVLGFWLLVAALLTDFLDGLAAKKLDAKTDFGETFDALADGTLVGAGVLGLGLAGELSWWVVAAVVAAMLAIGSDRLVPGWTKQDVVWRKVLSVGSLFIAWIGLAWFFAALAFGWEWWYVAVTVAIGVIASLLKRHRWKAWLGLS